MYTRSYNILVGHASTTKEANDRRASKSAERKSPLAVADASSLISFIHGKNFCRAPNKKTGDAQVKEQRERGGRGQRESLNRPSQKRNALNAAVRVFLHASKRTARQDELEAR